MPSGDHNAGSGSVIRKPRCTYSQIAIEQSLSLDAVASFSINVLTSPIVGIACMICDHASAEPSKRTSDLELYKTVPMLADYKHMLCVYLPQSMMLYCGVFHGPHILVAVVCIVRTLT